MCVFCDIIKKKKPASIVFEDDLAIAFMDINPVTKGHLMVVPKKHCRVFSEMDEDTVMHLFKVALKVSQAVRKSDLKCEGLNLFMSEESVAMQDIFHCHLHIIPRYKGDGFGLRANFSRRTSQEDLDEYAELIKKALKE